MHYPSTPPYSSGSRACVYDRLAWTGTDGALLAPVSVAEGEDIDSLLEDLRPLVLTIKEHRLNAGLSFDESRVVAHATDSFRKHAQRLRKFYSEIFAEGRLCATSDTPKATAARATAADHDDESATLVTGDPLHEVINFRKLVPAFANDARHAILDHQDMMARLSAKPIEVQKLPYSRPQELPGYAKQLLRTGVEQPLAAFKTELENKKDAAAALRAFLEQPMAHKSPTWKQMFKANPPRGTIARLGRHCRATLHETTAFRNFATVKQFRAEIRRMKAWYRRGKRLTRPQRGIKRSKKTGPHVRGLRTIWNGKVNKHYRILLRSRVRGLWCWRTVALSLHAAQIAVQGGTQPTERLWSCLLQMLPQAGRKLSLPWFTMLAKILYIRYNHIHYTRGALPTWCERDSLIMQRADTLAALLFDDAADTEHLHALFQPFLHMQK